MIVVSELETQDGMRHLFEAPIIREQVNTMKARRDTPLKELLGKKKVGSEFLPTTGRC